MFNTACYRKVFPTVQYVGQITCLQLRLNVYNGYKPRTIITNAVHWPA